MGHRQTIPNLIRRPKTRRLIRFSTVCIQKFLFKFENILKNTPNNPKNGNGLVQVIRMGKYIRHKWVCTCSPKSDCSSVLVYVILFWPPKETASRFAQMACYIETNQICFRSFFFNRNSCDTYGPRREKTCLRRFANNTGADQPAHPRSLISAFVIRVL